MTRVADLRPGERFVSTSGTAWELERHAGEISWAMRIERPEEPLNGRAVPVGARDRFAPRVRVERWTKAQRSEGSP